MPQGRTRRGKFYVDPPPPGGMRRSVQGIKEPEAPLSGNATLLWEENEQAKAGHWA